MLRNSDKLSRQKMLVKTEYLLNPLGFFFNVFVYLLYIFRLSLVCRFVAPGIYSAH